jgi:phosphatidylglycerol:prolipoprotein diacylglycerol transferase
MSFPHGTMPTTQRVHPAPLYEALAAFAIAAALWRLRGRLSDTALFGAFALLLGLERFLVEFVRLNAVVVAGLTAAQLWSLAFAALGAGLLLRDHPRRRLATAALDGAG